jgi:uridine kinase
MASTPYIVALAGPPGGGKTALMLALAQRLPQASWLSMDGFPIPAAMDGGALEAWLEGGADIDRLEISEFNAALGELKAGRGVIEPQTRRKVAAAPVVLVETPLGRAHAGTAPFIDVLVWLDTPLDIALARNLLAWEAQAEGRPRAWLADYARQYLGATRRVLIAQRAAVMAGADLVLDGLHNPSVLAEQVIGAVGALRA